MRDYLEMIPPQTGHAEHVIARDQPQYQPITVNYIRHADGTATILTRWALDAEQRAAIANGEDIYVTQLNFGGGMTPMLVMVGPGGFLENEGSIVEPAAAPTTEIDDRTFEAVMSVVSRWVTIEKEDEPTVRDRINRALTGQ